MWVTAIAFPLYTSNGCCPYLLRFLTNTFYIDIVALSLPTLELSPNKQLDTNNMILGQQNHATKNLAF